MMSKCFGFEDTSFHEQEVEENFSNKSIWLELYVIQMTFLQTLDSN